MLASLIAMELLAMTVPSLSAVAPREVILTVWRDRFLLLSHANATLLDSLCACVVVGLICYLNVTPIVPRSVVPLFRHLAALVNAIPLVAFVPILALIVDRSMLAVVFGILASLPVVWPIVLQWRSAADSAIDESPLRLSVPAGWGRVRLFGVALFLGPFPQVLRAGIPLCVFGATLSGFVNGNPGLGVYLSVAMWQGDHAKILAGALVTTSICGLAYSAANIVEALRPGDMRVLIQPHDGLPVSTSRRVRRWISTLATALVIWVILAFAAGNPYFVKFPLEIFDPSNYDAGTGLQVFSALKQTLELSAAGLVVGTASACLLIALGSLARWTRWLSLPVVFVSQTVPLTVLVAIIVAVCGRGFLTAMVFATSVCFFSTFVIVQDGLERLWYRYGDLCDVFGRRRFIFAVRVLIPGLRVYVVNSLMVSAPRAFLGVLLAEYLVSRSGTGGLMYGARGTMDIEMLWLLLALVALIGISIQSLIPVPRVVFHLGSNNSN